MMTKNKTNPAAILRIAIVIPLSLFLIIALASCSGSRKAANSKTEAPPPPPPPPAPPSVQTGEIFTIVEQMPVYPGGDTAMIGFISRNVKYPKEAKDQKIEGRVITRFCVTTEGNTNNIQVLKGVHPVLDNEAIRVIKLLTGFKPGMQGGKPVNVWYTIPVTFSLSGGSMTPPKYTVNGADTIYFNPKEPAQFPGGKEALAKFKTDNLKIPADLVNAGFSGNVGISFIVDRDGKKRDITVSMGLIPSLDAEALRVARLMPDWIPAKDNGKTVISRQNTSFSFQSAVPGADVPKEVFVVVEEMPHFPGGDTALMNFISMNIRYPKEAKEKGIQGRVIMRFAVNYLGNVEQIGVIKGVDPLLDFEAIRVIKQLPVWEPGKQGGKPVNVWYAVPITFALKGDDLPKDKQVNNTAPPPPPPVPVKVTGYDEPPLFPGGDKALLQFLQTSVKYPELARAQKISGTVKVKFLVSVTGTIENITVYSSVHPLLDAEALRVVMMMPSWQPGKLKGNPVSVQYIIPVTFK